MSKFRLFRGFKNPIDIQKIDVKRKLRRFSWKKAGRYFGYAVIAFVIFCGIMLAWFSKDLPTPQKIAAQKPAQSTKIYDRTGKVLLYETGEQRRTLVQADQMSDYLKKATVATEDASFYSHHGFDPKAIAAVAFEKITFRKQKTRGASTITQQYVKNALLDSDRTLTRKIKELILAIELEIMYSKSDILTMYLNEIPYGSNVAGVEAASQMYYGVSAKDVTLAQAATLAAIPQAPTYYSPYGTHTDKLIARRNYVLDRMVETKQISKDEAETAKKVDTTTVGVAVKPRKDSMLAPHFAMYVIEKAADSLGEEKIQKEGLTIITSLDYDKQKIAEQAITDGVAKINQYGASNAAMTAVDPKTGEILAMVGSIDYFNVGIDGNVNVTDAARQPGSSFKPFAYSTAFKQKDFSPSKILFDLQTDFGGGYVPQNYNGKFNGPITVRTALSNSLNIPAVKTLSLAGIDNTLSTASDMGITTLTHRDQYGLSLVLGAGEVKPVEMAGAFGVFATGGVKHDLKSILKVSDAKGKTLFEYKSEDDKGKQVLDPQIAYEISNILSDNQARAMVFGTHTALAFSGKTIAAKTGTTTSFKDAWTVGYSKSIAAAVWVGNNDNTAMKKGADGSVIAAPIFHNFMDKVVTTDEPFDVPAGIKTVTVDKYSNKLPSDLTSETTTDIFADWQVPTDKDSTHQKVTVCKSNGLLAPEGMPASYIEDRIYTIIHSERPDNPNWENPVRAWASAAGLNNLPPTDKCNPGDISAAISITSPVDGSSVSGNSVIAASVQNGYNIKNVTFFIDGVSVGTVSNSPYEMTYNFSNLSAGSHSISAVVTDGNDATAKATIAVNVTKAPQISNLSGTRTDVSHVKVTWNTNIAATSQVIFGGSSIPNEPYSYPGSSTLDSSYVTSHSVIIESTGKTYIRAKSKNSDGDTGVSLEINVN